MQVSRTVIPVFRPVFNWINSIETKEDFLINLLFAGNVSLLNQQLGNQTRGCAGFYNRATNILS
jgi:hypothetical protein